VFEGGGVQGTLSPSKPPRLSFHPFTSPRRKVVLGVSKTTPLVDDVLELPELSSRAFTGGWSLCILCLAGTQTPDSLEESRCSAQTILVTQAV